MEEELLRSKTEMMLLNNQLLEAVQKRLELTLELDAWKVNLRHEEIQGLTERIHPLTTVNVHTKSPIRPI